MNYQYILFVRRELNVRSNAPFENNCANFAIHFTLSHEHARHAGIINIGCVRSCTIYASSTFEWCDNYVGKTWTKTILIKIDHNWNWKFWTMNIDNWTHLLLVARFKYHTHSKTVEWCNANTRSHTLNMIVGRGQTTFVVLCSMKRKRRICIFNTILFKEQILH